jgi:hypothetical protein
LLKRGKEKKEKERKKRGVQREGGKKNINDMA